jgi:hypothetical protein
LEVTKLSRGFSYMRLLRATGDGVEFSTWGDGREIEFFALD